MARDSEDMDIIVLLLDAGAAGYVSRCDDDEVVDYRIDFADNFLDHIYMKL